MMSFFWYDSDFTQADAPLSPKAFRELLEWYGINIKFGSGHLKLHKNIVY